MPRLSPSEHAARWAQQFGASAEKYKAGIRKVQGNPAQRAIAAKDRLLANFTESVVNGRWEAGLANVSEASWKAACEEKGAAALATSARVAQEKVARAEAKMGPIRDGIVSSLPARGDINANLERAREIALRMHEARKRG